MDKKLTKWEIKRIRQALHFAIDMEWSVYQAYITSYHKRSKQPKMVVAKEFKNEAAVCRRNIKAWEKILKKLGNK